MFYNIIFNKLLKFEMLDEGTEIKLHFISVGDRKTGTSGGKTKVKSTVKRFIKNSKSGDFDDVISSDNVFNSDDVVYLDDVVYGIVDRDNDTDNDPQCNIEVLQRYAIENYIYDPIYLFFYLKEKHKEEFLNFFVNNEKNKRIEEMLKTENYDLIKDQMSLQEIIDIFMILIFKSENDLKDTETLHYKFSKTDEIDLKYPLKFILMNGHNLEDKLKKRFPVLGQNEKPLIRKFLEFLREKLFEKFSIIPSDLISTFNNILFYKSNELRLNIFEYLNKKDKNMKAIVKELTQPLYKIDFLTKILEETRKLIERKSNLTQDDRDKFNKLRKEFNEFDEMDKIDKIDYEVKDTDREFLDKYIVNLLERQLNKKQSPDEISNTNIQDYIYTLLKELKENQSDQAELQKRKDKLVELINQKLNNKNIRIKFGKI
jgi:hypothetical protein